MNLENIKTNKIRMILGFSVPSIIAMVLTSLITVTDGFFIGNYVGKMGLAAVNLGLPIIYLYLAVGLMVSVGGIAIAGMAFGGGDLKKSNNVFNQTIATSIISAFLLSIVLWLCFEPMLRFLNADLQVKGYFKAYYSMMLLQLPVMILNSAFGMFIRGEGSPRYFMQVNIVNVLLNIIMDYLFVARLGLGVQGVAAASLLSTLVALVCTLAYFVKKSKVYKISSFTYSGKVLRNTLLNGGSEFIGQLAMSISMFAYNYVILREIGVDGVTAFTIVGYIAYMFSMVVIGFGQGSSPLISFVYGAGQPVLAMALRKRTNAMVLAAGAVVFLFILVGAGWYSSLFVRSAAIEQMVRSGVLFYAVSFLFSGVNTISSFYFTAIGKAMESAVISSARGLVLLLFCIFTLPPLLGMTGVWLVAPVTEGATLFISLFFIWRENNTQYGVDKAVHG